MVRQGRSFLLRLHLVLVCHGSEVSISPLRVCVLCCFVCVGILLDVFHVCGVFQFKELLSRAHPELSPSARIISETNLIIDGTGDILHRVVIDKDGMPGPAIYLRKWQSEPTSDLACAVSRDPRLLDRRASSDAETVGVATSSHFPTHLLCNVRG